MDSKLCPNFINESELVDENIGEERAHVALGKKCTQTSLSKINQTIRIMEKKYPFPIRPIQVAPTEESEQGPLKKIPGS